MDRLRGSASKDGCNEIRRHTTVTSADLQLRVRVLVACLCLPHEESIVWLAIPTARCESIVLRHMSREAVCLVQVALLTVMFTCQSSTEGLP